MKTNIAIVIAVAVLLPIVSHAADPLHTAPSESVAGTQKLHESIVGTVWLHHYKGHDFEFAFGKSGSIELHKNWKGTTWRVVSPTEVIFEGTTGAKMIFTFDTNAETFTNIDWDGTPTTGKRTARKLE